MRNIRFLSLLSLLFLVSCVDLRGEGDRRATISDDPQGDELGRQAGYKLDFILPENGDWVELRSHASRPSRLEGGLVFRFTRTDDVLFLNVQGPGLVTNKQVELLEVDRGSRTDNRFTFYIDVHNDERPAKLYFWFVSHDFTLAEDCSNCDKYNAFTSSEDFDSYPEEFPEYIRSNTRGVGTYWGTFRSDDAVLISAEAFESIEE